MERAQPLSKDKGQYGQVRRLAGGRCMGRSPAGRRPPGWLPTRPWPPPGVESRPGRAAVRRHADSTFELIEQGPILDRPGIGPELHFRGRVAGIRTRDLLTPRRRLVNHSRTPTPLTWVCVVRWTIGVHGERLQMPHYLPHWVTGHCKARPRRLIHGDGGSVYPASATGKWIGEYRAPGTRRRESGVSETEANARLRAVMREHEDAPSEETSDTRLGP
jgi:hypothetical protein